MCDSRLLLSTGLLAAAALTARADDLFSPFINATAPRIMRLIEGTAPSTPGTTVNRVVFASIATPAASGGEPRVNEVYAVIARPADPPDGPLPGLLLLHGGGGFADETGAIEWARRGYIVVAPDLPGIADPEKVPHSAGAWKERPYGEGRWTASPDATASTIFQDVAAALQSFNLLRAQPGVDKTRIGVTGTSWGGYTTTMVCGLLGTQVRAAFSNYGSGFYEDAVFKDQIASKMGVAEREVWYAGLDAGRRAAGITAPFFIAGATNDAFFYPPAVEKTLAAITAPANRLYAPNANHQLPVPGGTMNAGGSADMAATWFAWHLQGRGSDFPIVTLESANPDTPVACFHVQGPRPILSAAVWHSAAPGQGGWPNRAWKQVVATPLAGGRYEAALPPEALAPGSAWFALVSDDRPVSTSSPMVMRRNATAVAARPSDTR